MTPFDRPRTVDEDVEQAFGELVDAPAEPTGRGAADDAPDATGDGAARPSAADLSEAPATAARPRPCPASRRRGSLA
ncbi:MAG: hypothetical protein H6704_08385 [Myxococcales bacterium]|nr:hypothetical protein [Myxococcales bacterium]